MKELFPLDNTKEAYNFFTTFLQKHCHIRKIRGKFGKDFLDIEFKYNSLELKFHVWNFNRKCFDQLELWFSPFDKYGDYTTYILSGREINISNLEILLKLCKLHDIPTCKKCGKHPIKYYEECLCKTTYPADLTGNPYIYKNGFNDDYQGPPFPIKLSAECSCSNKWIPKGIFSARQIVDKSVLDNELYPLNRRSHMIARTSKEIHEMNKNFNPHEYAILENKKNPLKRTKSNKENH